MEKINSPIFGEVNVADELNKYLLKEFIKMYPLDVFQILNKDVLNPRGFQISIEGLEKEKENVDSNL